MKILAASEARQSQCSHRSLSVQVSDPLARPLLRGLAAQPQRLGRVASAQSGSPSSALTGRTTAARQILPLKTDTVHKGRLDGGDRPNPFLRNRFMDAFRLRVKPGKTVSISLASKAFDPILQVVDKQRDRLLFSNDDRGPGDRNSYLQFTAERRIRYQIQVTSFDQEATGRYRLKVKIEDAPKPTFDARSGYGLVDAAAAVAAALRKSPFADVPSQQSLWGLDAIKAPAAWAQGFTGQGVTVAVLDTGVNYRHKDLRANMWKNPGEIARTGRDDDKNGFIDDVRGWKFVDEDSNDPFDFHGHGSHVAGTIAAGNNGFGITGVAYDAKIMPVKVIDGRDDPFTRRFDQNLAAGIRYAVDNGARVINMSLGSFLGEPTLKATQRALKYARKSNVISIMAAGNSGAFPGVKGPLEPAAFAAKNLGIAVGAVNRNLKVANFSNPAGNKPMPFVVAPGVRIKSTVERNRYDLLSGTSMAAPHVAGVVALMLSANPNLTAAQVTRILIRTANSTAVKS